MASNNSNTGRGAINAGLASAAANLSGPAADLASGASAFTAATNALKGAALDKLLGPTAVFAGSLLGVLRTVKAIVDQSGILERGLKRIASVQQIQGKFETLLKSAEKASARLKDLYRFTASSPFDFSDVAEGNRILEALTKGALSSARGMKIVGDVAASTGQSFTETAERVGKLYNALKSGRGIDKVLFNLQASGAVTDELAAKLEQASASGAGFAEVWAVVEGALSQAEGGMRNEMGSLDALTARLAAASAMMEQAFSEPFTNAQAKSIEATVKATENLTPVLRQMGQDLAPLLTFFRSVKNEITVATLATKGFADALLFAWSMAKALFSGAVVVTLASFAGNFSRIARGMLSFGANLKASRRIVDDYSRAVGDMRRATLLAAQANKAFDAGNVVAGVKLKALAVQAGVAARAVNLHRTAKVAAKTSEGGFSFTNYAAATAGQLAVGAAGVVRRGALGAVGALRSFAVANPVLLAGMAASAAGDLFEQWTDKVKKANDEYATFLNNLGKLRTEARESVDGVKTLDDWRDAAASVAKQLAEARDILRGLDVNDADFQPKFIETIRTLRRLNVEQARLKARPMDTVALSETEKARIVEDTDKRLSLRDATEQTRADRGDDYTRRAVLMAQSKRLELEAKIGRENAQGIDAPERYRGKPTDLMAVNARIAAMEKAKHAVPRELYEKRAELAKLAETYREREAQKLSVDTELQALGNKIRLKELELAYEKQIAAIKARGGETASVEAEKQEALLKAQLRLAIQQGRTLDADDARTQIAALTGERGLFKAGAGLDRAKNQALANDNPRAALAVDDVRALRQLREQYAANGLSHAQADSDFFLGLKAQAMANGPKIIADSMQSIGGGGGFGSSNPVVAALMRQTEATNRAESLLALIERNTASAAGGVQ
jgi:hypothetical protein